MSNVEPEEAVTASSDGVTVEKSFEPDDFPVPAIAFVVHSERDEPVSIRLLDSVPGHVPPEDIGFHPKYGAEFWSVEGDSIVFEREFDPEEEYTTVYGLRGGDAEDADEFMSEPRLESVDPPLDESDADTGSADDASPDGTDDGEAAESGTEDDAPDEVATAVQEVDSGLSDDEGDDSSLDAGRDSVESLDVSIDSSNESDVDEADETSAATDGETGGSSSTVVPEDESLVSALAAEIRSGDVDDEELDELRDALGVDDEGGSVDARIEHLQSEVSDLQAYTDALEEFLDEHGDAQTLIQDVRDDFEGLSERLDDVEETAETAASDAADVSEELESLREEAGEATDERVEELESEVEALSEELEENVEELSEELEDVAEMRDRLTSALGGLSPQDGDDDDASDADDE